MNPQAADPGSASRPRSPFVTCLGALALVSLVLAPSGCGLKRDARESRSAPSAVMFGAPARAPAPTSGSVEEADVATTSAPAAGATATASRREIIYTGVTTLEVDDVEKTAARVETTLATVRGWTAGRQLNVDAEGRHVATLAMRVPSPRFLEVHDSVRRLGDVVRDEVRSQDAGMEFVDLESRVRNLQREEGVISGLFSRGGKIDDVLQVERELARVRGEIEQAQGRLRFLTDQVSFSTLNLELVPRRPAMERKVASWNMGYHLLRAWRLLVSVVRGITYVLAYMTIVAGPFALLGWGIWRLVRSRRRAPAA